MATASQAGDNILLSYVNAGYHSVPLSGSVCYILQFCHIWLE